MSNRLQATIDTRNALKLLDGNAIHIKLPPHAVVLGIRLTPEALRALRTMNESSLADIMDVFLNRGAAKHA